MIMEYKKFVNNKINSYKNNENDEDFSNRKLNTFWKLRRII